MASADLPMPTPTVPRRPLTEYKVVSYDIYGTLVDWESSIVRLLQPLVSRIPSDSKYAHLRNSSGGKGRLALAAQFNDLEHEIQKEQPELRYDLLLAELYRRAAHEFGVEVSEEVESDAKKFGQSIGSWDAFPDTVQACQRLSKYYRLVPLSNVDKESFQKTCSGPLKGIDFWRIYTAQDIGSYKPDLRNFDYLIRKVKEEGGVEKDEILHTAQSLFHDHVPAKKMGLSSVWIARQGAGMGGAAEGLHEREEVGYGWRFATLGEMADAVEEAFEREKK